MVWSEKNSKFTVLRMCIKGLTPANHPLFFLVVKKYLHLENCTAASSSAADARYHARTTTHDDEKVLRAQTANGHNAGDADRWGTVALGVHPGNNLAALFFPCDVTHTATLEQI